MNNDLDFKEITLGDLWDAKIIVMNGSDEENKELIEITKRMKEKVDEEIRKEFWQV